MLTLILIETPFNTFTNRADPDQAALQELPDQGLLCLIRYDPTLGNLRPDNFSLFNVQT